MPRRPRALLGAAAPLAVVFSVSSGLASPGPGRVEAAEEDGGAVCMMQKHVRLRSPNQVPWSSEHGWPTSMPTSRSCASEHLVVVRSHRPLPGMVGRMRAFAEELRGLEPRVRFVVSVDVSDGSAAYEELRRELPDHVLGYSASDLSTRYPAGWGARAGLPGECPWRPSNRDSHVESVLLTLDRARRGGALA